MSFESIAKNLGRDYGVPFDGGDRLLFELDGQETICVERSGEGESFALYAGVAPLPRANQAFAYRLLLEANLFGRGTHRAVLAIDDQSERVILFQWFEEDTLDYAQFVEELGQFVDNIRYWKRMLLQVEQSQPEQRPKRPAGAKRV